MLDTNRRSVYRLEVSSYGVSEKSAPMGEDEMPMSTYRYLTIYQRSDVSMSRCRYVAISRYRDI